MIEEAQLGPCRNFCQCQYFLNYGTCGKLPRDSVAQIDTLENVWLGRGCMVGWSPGVSLSHGASVALVSLKSCDQAEILAHLACWKAGGGITDSKAYSSDPVRCYCW